MRKKLISSCLVLIMALATVAVGSEPHPIPEHCHDNTVIVRSMQSHGSGALYTKEDTTFVWTAGHVIDQYMKRDGTFSDFLIIQGTKRAKARVLRCADYRVAHDLALLKIIRGTLKGDARFYEDFDNTELGQEIIHCGTPFDIVLNSNLLFFGNVSHIGRMFRIRPMTVAREVDQCDLPTYPGCSGGPVFDAETGGILGLMVIGGKPGLSVMVPTRVIHEWAESHDCLWAFDPDVPLPEEDITPWLGDKFERLQKQQEEGAENDASPISVKIRYRVRPEKLKKAG